jgi:pimeloyl-ACP methyl ester carboxylesterase
MNTAATITTRAAWEATGRYRQLCGHGIFTIDAPSIGPEVHEPLLILHGFPTSSFDFVAVLDVLRAGRRVLLFDGLGYGLSAKPPNQTKSAWPWRPPMKNEMRCPTRNSHPGQLARHLQPGRVTPARGRA